MSALIPLVLTIVGQSAGLSGPAALSGSLAVLPIVVAGPHGEASVSDIYDTVTRATETRVGLRVISAEEIFVASRDGLTQRIADCGPDAGCIASKLRMFDARYGLVVVLSFELSPPIFSLQLLDTDSGRMVGEQVGDVGSRANPMARLFGKADALLVAAGFVKSGRVVIEVEPKRAQLRLTQGIEPDLGTANVFTLAPGHYTAEGLLEGHHRATVDFEVHSGASKTVQLVLKEDSSILSSPWLWIAVGAVVVGGSAAAIAVSQNPAPCVCTTLNGVGCACR